MARSNGLIHAVQVRMIRLNRPGGYGVSLENLVAEIFLKFCDLSPPAMPSIVQQGDALRKGLGRAMQWALRGQLAEEVLLEACLHDQRYDMQVAERRGNWLWQMIRVLQAAERFPMPILDALRTFPDQRSALQLCELAQLFAAAGDERFRSRLYEILEQQPIADWSALGEEEIVSLDGEAGFLIAAGLRGRQLHARAWDWEDTLLLERAIEQFGEHRVDELLDNATDEPLSKLLQGWRQHVRQQAERKPVPASRARMRAIAASEIISRAHSGNAGYGQFRSWGMHADESDLATVLQQLWTTESVSALANLLGVFANRALPQFDAHLIDLCRHQDEVVRWRAYTALAKNTHPLVRRFALEHLERAVSEGPVIGLFTHNYEAGDEHRLLEAMVLPSDEDQLHALLMDSAELLEANPTADCSQLATIVYASTPCENCRFFALRLLDGQQVIPQWMREECRHDSAEDCRNFVELAKE